MNINKLAKNLTKNICKVKPYYFIKVDFKNKKGYVNGFNELVQDFEAAYLSSDKTLIEVAKYRFIYEFYFKNISSSIKKIKKHIKVHKIERPENEF